MGEISSKILCDSLAPIKLFSNKVIAYIYMSDYLFIQALIKAYRQDITKIRLRKIKIDDLKMIDKQFDYLFTYVVIGSEYMKTLKYSKYFYK